MDWQLNAVLIIVAGAVAGFVKIVFFPKHRGCSCCDSPDCPGRRAGAGGGECPRCSKNRTQQK